MKKNILTGISIIFLGTILVARQFINHSHIFRYKYVYKGTLGILFGIGLIYFELKKLK